MRTFQALTLVICFGTLASASIIAPALDEDADSSQGQIPCPVGIPQETPSRCLANRSQELQAKKNVYKIGVLPGTQFPSLDMDVNKLFQLYLQDPFTKKFTQLYIHMLRKVEYLTGESFKRNNKEFTNYKQYAEVANYFIDELQKPKETMGKYFRVPWNSLPFKSIITNESWKDDKVFSDRRLAGLDPMCLTRVTAKRGMKGLKWTLLRKRLNLKFRWGAALRRAFGPRVTFAKAVKKGRLFVCQFPYLDNLPTMPDAMDPRQFRKMWKSMSPIALFASIKGKKGKASLVPVAIQLDSKPDSPVYTPSDGDLWLLAKEAFEGADFINGQLVDHLQYAHFMMDHFCVAMHRHFSRLHPLQQILRYHCRGIFPLNKVGAQKLLMDEKSSARLLFPSGAKGGLEILNRAFKDMTWAVTDFHGNLKKRGVDDKKTLPYFPYRDDGILMHREIEKFAKKYISNYYSSDIEVWYDKELQAFANEMSANGKGGQGGPAKIRGFPARIRSVKMLKDIFTRLLFHLTVQHASVNYPVAAYGVYVPGAPTKVYDDSRVPKDKFNVFRLPNGNTSTVHAATSMILGMFHLDNLFDYGHDLQDKTGGAIVQKAFTRLNKVIKPIMEARDLKRLRQGHLSYPFFTPGWLTNSICT